MNPNNNPKVLIVVSGGVAYPYADNGVDVAVADLDELRDSGPSAVMPIHAAFRHLLELACIADDWPTGHDGCFCDEARHPDIEGGVA
jgi:hypothetical protein